MAYAASTDPDWAELMAAAQAGDGRAYARLLRALLPVVRALARRQGVPPAHVEDVVQDVLLAVHRVRHTYDPALPFLPWLAAITRRRAIDMMRREGRRGAWESSGVEQLETFADPASNSETEARDLGQWLAQAVERLPPRQRRALELVKIRDMSMAEAARESGQTEGAVKVNVHRALRALRVMLGRDPAR